MNTTVPGPGSDTRPILLCVDDEPNDLAALRRSFAREPVQVLATGDPLEALAWIDHRKVSLVIADQKMPDMTGIALLRIVQERSPDTARVLITGLPDPGSVAEPAGGAVHRWVGKPWDEEELRTTVLGLLGRPAKRSPRRPFLQESVVWLDAAQKTAVQLLCPVAARIVRLGLDQRRLVLPIRRLPSFDDSPLRLLRGLLKGLERHSVEADLLDPSGIFARLHRAGANPGNRLRVHGLGQKRSPPRRVLVASADTGELAFFAHLCRTLGLDAVPASGRDAALRALEAGPTEFGVVDADLPEGGAMEVVQRLATGGKPARIVLTAKSDPGWDYEVYERWGIGDRLFRPYFFEDAIQAVRSLSAADGEADYSG